ncbi:MAG: hypothetical protein VB023_09645 [Oscillibacter sp.]|nr:hypothetical protein [Oscillibacter sp.]
MSNAVLISIRPQWCEMIASGRKTVEVRKSCPKLETPFKCYIYCTQGEEKWLVGIIGKHPSEKLNGKVIGEFVCDNITNLFADSRFWLDEKAVEQTRLTGDQIRAYANGKKAIYGWYISDLQIYDKPKELSEFKQCHKCPYGPIERCNEHQFSCDGTYALSRPPQSWCYVGELT